MSKDMMAFIAVLVLIGAPVLGLTARFALKPLIEALLRLREPQSRPQPELMALQREVATLTATVAELKDALHRAEDATRFYDELHPMARGEPRLPRR